MLEAGEHEGFIHYQVNYSTFQVTAIDTGTIHLEAPSISLLVSCATIKPLRLRGVPFGPIASLVPSTIQKGAETHEETIAHLSEVDRTTRVEVHFRIDFWWLTLG